MAAVNDIVELEKKLTHEEEAQILAQEQEEDVEEQVDINLLKQDPEDIEKFVEAEYQKELLLEQQDNNQEEKKEVSTHKNTSQDSKQQPTQNQQQPSRWRWLWGQLPEKNVTNNEQLPKIDQKVEKPADLTPAT